MTDDTSINVASMIFRYVLSVTATERKNVMNVLEDVLKLCLLGYDGSCITILSIYL